MKYILAVSGGIDSMVLLDMMSKVADAELIVAHFDHGIRPESADDARFVEAAAERYGYRFIARREELGPETSEARARSRRYAFLRSISREHQAPIVTAHHLDDLSETVAINLTRGTGWRGLAVFDAEIIRPLLDTPKASLEDYARRWGIEWREDPTNATDTYLRNRIRRKAMAVPHEHKRQLRALQMRQRELKRAIEAEVRELVGEGPSYSRYLLIHVPEAVAVECLRYCTDGALTMPQLRRALHAVKTAAAGSRYEAGSGVVFHFTTRHFTL